jgi:hypothetical protein
VTDCFFGVPEGTDQKVTQPSPTLPRASPPGLGDVRRGRLPRTLTEMVTALSAYAEQAELMPSCATVHPRSHPRFIHGYSVFKERCAFSAPLSRPQKDTGTLSSAAGRAPGAQGRMASGAQRHHPLRRSSVGNLRRAVRNGPLILRPSDRKVKT